MKDFTKAELELAVELHGEELVSVLNAMLRTDNPLSQEAMLKPMLQACLKDASAQLNAIDQEAA